MLNRFKDAALTVMANLMKAVNVNTELKNDQQLLEFVRDIKMVEKPEKYIYARPSFLGMGNEEIQCSQNVDTRPVLTSTVTHKLPLDAGYAECINAGKSKFNEDNSFACVMSLKSCSPNIPVKSNSNNSRTNVKYTAHQNLNELQMTESCPVVYFGLFDGHAGYSTSLITSLHLHAHLQTNLGMCLDLISESLNERLHPDGVCNGAISVNVDELVIGAIEAAFQDMDKQLDDESQTYKVNGGCTALVVLFLKGKMYVANAGDSRAVLCRGETVTQVSTDFSPALEKQRINCIGDQRPELLHNEFTCLEFQRRMRQEDVGSLRLCRKPGMAGWAYKKIDEDDLKYPLVTGDGKKARIMGTIGVSRGLGDHDLYLFESNICIKPFLSCIPEVRVIDLTKDQWTDEDFLILATDGLWDVITNTQAVEIIRKDFSSVSARLKTYSKLTSAIQAIVKDAKGSFNGKVWQRKDKGMASYDDISAYLIPIKTYLDLWEQGKLSF